MDTAESVSYESSTFSLENTSIFVANTSMIPAERGSVSSSLHTFSLIQGVLGIVILVLNIGVVYCIKRWTGLKLVTRVLLINLGASDIMYGLTSLFNALIVIPRMSLTICSVSFAFKVVSGCVCSNSIMLLAIDIFASALFSQSRVGAFLLAMPFIGTLIGLGWLLFLAFACWMIIQVNGTSCNFMEMLHMQSTGVVVSAMIIQSVISLVIYGLTLTITAYRIRKL